MKSEPKRIPLKELAESYGKALRVNPEYQRGTTWSKAQKQSLIDSLLRGYELPLFYVHLEQKLNTYTKQNEVSAHLVDGQQRLAAIADYLNNQFALLDPRVEKSGSVVPSLQQTPPRWAGKRFDELNPEDRETLLGRKLHVIEMTEDAPNEARDLFIRLQAGTPLTAQQKRDAWPGDFTLFVIRHAGKQGHPESRPKPFFDMVARGKAKTISVDDGEHYVDRLADTRKFFAGLAMTIMVRDRQGADFVDLKGKTINEFYQENLTLKQDDRGAARVIQTLDEIPKLPGFQELLTRKPATFQLAFHFSLVVDSLLAGDFVPHWRNDVTMAFQKFQDEVAKARQHYKDTKEELPYYSRFVRLLGGSGSDTADVIRRRHYFFLEQLHPLIKITPRDPVRLFDSLAREVIWIRDRGTCQNPECKVKLGFADGHIHHIDEHTIGGRTVLGNGILVCPSCHSNRSHMQTLKPLFQDLVARATAAADPTRRFEYL